MCRVSLQKTIDFYKYPVFTHKFLKLSIMRKILLSILLVIFCTVSYAQTPEKQGNKDDVAFLTESFEGGMPFGWEVTWEGSPIGHGNWIANEYTMHPYNHAPHDGNMLIYFDSFTAYPYFYARLETPELNLSSLSTANLSFWIFHNTDPTTSNDTLIIQYRVGQGEWNSLYTITRVWENYDLEWVKHDVDLTEICGNSNVTIAFWGISAYGSDINMDLVEITGSSTAPEFVSTPITETTAGQVYTYNVLVEDDGGDISQLEIIGEYLPDWLTLTDNGNGNGVLTGTPTNNDAGTNAVFLRAVDDDDNSTSHPFDIEVTAASSILETEELAILNIYPNPAKEYVKIDISSTKQKSVNITIYNFTGQEIFELNKNLINGKNEIIWTRTNNTGNIVPPGMYFINISDGKNVVTHKITLL